MVTLITDRTLSDVSAARDLMDTMRYGTATTQQIAAYNAGLRGAWGWHDFTRIQDAIDELSEILYERGKLTFAVRINPDKGSIATITAMEGLLNNIVKVTEAYVVPPLSPALPSLDGQFTVQKANAIEQYLQTIYDLLATDTTEPKYAGNQLYAGGMTL